MSANKQSNVKRELSPATNRRPAGSMSLAALLMMSGLLLSKITGQLREILVPYVFGGVGILSDAYNLSFQIPDLFYQLLVGGAIQAAITPTLAAAIERREEKKSWRSISIFINFTAVAVMIAVLVGELLTPVLIPLYDNKDPAVIGLAVHVTQALFPQVFFMMLAALCIGILNAYKKFASTSFGPAVYNICVVLAMVLLGSSTARGPVLVASGVMLSAMVYFVLQFSLARREFRHYKLSFNYRDEGFRRLLKLAIPTLLSGSIVQINMIILTNFADGVGATTWLRNASTTWQLPYGIFAVAIGNVMLPSLSGLNAIRDYDGSRRLFTRSLRSALFMIIPFAAMFLVMSQDVIRAIFQWGAGYSEKDVIQAASILGWYCLAMVAQTVVFIVNQAFYARKMTRIALMNGVLTLVLNYLLCLLLEALNSGSVGNLSLAYAITSVISVIVLYSLYCRNLPAAAPRRLWPFSVRALFCAATLVLLVLALNALPVQPSGKFLELAWLSFRALAGVAVYVLTAIALGMPEAHEAMQKLQGVGRRLRLRR